MGKLLTVLAILCGDIFASGCFATKAFSQDVDVMKPVLSKVTFCEFRQNEAINLYKTIPCSISTFLSTKDGTVVSIINFNPFENSQAFRVSIARTLSNMNEVYLFSTNEGEEGQFIELIPITVPIYENKIMFCIPFNRMRICPHDSLFN